MNWHSCKYHHSFPRLWTYSTGQWFGVTLFGLLGRHYLEDVGPEGGVGKLKDVARPHQVEPGLVLVHRVQDRLKPEDLVKISSHNHQHRISFVIFASIWVKSFDWRVAIERIGFSEKKLDPGKERE